MPEVSGVILAGGQSRRLGTNKALLELGSKSLIERVVDNLCKVFTDVMVVTNQHFDSLPKGVRVIPDIIPGKGSLGGLYTGLKNSLSLHVFAVACDMPFLDLDLIRFMLKEAKSWDVVMPRTEDGYQPLHAIYSCNCLPFIENQLTFGRLAIIEFFPFVRLNVIEKEQLRKFNQNGLSFFNVNTMEDWKRAQLINQQMGRE